jgi:hypothetical protein
MMHSLAAGFQVSWDALTFGYPWWNGFFWGFVAALYLSLLVRRLNERALELGQMVPKQACSPFCELHPDRISRQGMKT